MSIEKELPENVENNELSEESAVSANVAENPAEISENLQDLQEHQEDEPHLDEISEESILPEENSNEAEKEENVVENIPENSEEMAANTEEVAESEISQDSEQPEEEPHLDEISEEIVLPEENINETETEESAVENISEMSEKTSETSDIAEVAETEISQNLHQEEESDLSDEIPKKVLSLEETISEMEKIVNEPEIGFFSKAFNQLKESAHHLIQDEIEHQKTEFLSAGNEEENFNFTPPALSKLNELSAIFKEKLDHFHKKQEEEYAKNAENRKQIIENLKNLYVHSQPETNFFKEIRKIKEQWSHAGQVAKKEFVILNNDYFHHLNQFYAMLDLNKEYLEQEYEHNLEKRRQIINHAKELENETSVQKALNELQYLHKLWKEEAEPVAEEFREKTWDEFKEISNRIHHRKSELVAVWDAEKIANFERKNQIIEELKTLANPEKGTGHGYWQKTIKKVESLRNEFLKTGGVPKKESTKNWNHFKDALRSFNIQKNNFYKSLKENQIKNLEEKLKLIQTAKDNMLSEDWNIAIPLFRKLQDEWKTFGHVPRSQSGKIWEDFREACNTFFKNYREKNEVLADNWKENYKHKKAILEDLKQVTNEENGAKKIEKIKTSWNSVGKVPKDKIGINSEFNNVLREKLRINKLNEFDIRESGLSEIQITDKARKLKSQISDLEAEIVKLETNLGFFNNPTKENPLLKDTFKKIDDKKAQLEHLKQNFRSIIS
jgi:hypothetical protein